MKVNARNILHLFVVEFVDIKSHGVQERFSEDVGFTTPQEPPKPTVLLQNPKGTFCLDGAVDP